jgi:hypothetical protein
MNALGWGEGGAAWAWRRQLWAWEEDLLGELRSALTTFVMQPNVLDQLVWCHDLGGGYYVRGAYEFLTTRHVHDMIATSNLIWHKQVPLKVSLMA